MNMVPDSLNFNRTVSGLQNATIALYNDNTENLGTHTKCAYRKLTDRDDAMTKTITSLRCDGYDFRVHGGSAHQFEMDIANKRAPAWREQIESVYANTQPKNDVISCSDKDGNLTSC